LRLRNTGRLLRMSLALDPATVLNAGFRFS
jgi:hypothetical protein